MRTLFSWAKSRKWTSAGPPAVRAGIDSGSAPIQARPAGRSGAAMLSRPGRTPRTLSWAAVTEFGAFLLPAVRSLGLLAFLLLGRYPGCEAIVRLSERIAGRGVPAGRSPPRAASACRCRRAPSRPAGGLLIALGLAQRPPPAPRLARDERRTSTRVAPSRRCAATATSNRDPAREAARSSCSSREEHEMNAETAIAAAACWSSSPCVQLIVLSERRQRRARSRPADRRRRKVADDRSRQAGPPGGRHPGPRPTARATRSISRSRSDVAEEVHLHGYDVARRSRRAAARSPSTCRPTSKASSRPSWRTARNRSSS